MSGKFNDIRKSSVASKYGCLDFLLISLASVEKRIISEG